MKKILTTFLIVGTAFAASDEDDMGFMEFDEAYFTKYTIDHLAEIAPPTTNIVDVPVVDATPESTKGYGVILKREGDHEVEIAPWPQQTERPVIKGDEGCTVEGTFTMEWVGRRCLAINNAVGAQYITGLVYRENDILTHEANYHPDGSQNIFPISPDPFVLMLSKKESSRIGDIGPEDFKAFRFDGTKGFSIHPGVWHQPAYPLWRSRSMRFSDEQGAVHACVPVNFVRERGVWARIPGVLSRVVRYMPK